MHSKEDREGFGITVGGLEQNENRIDREAMSLTINPRALAISKLKLYLKRARVE